MECWNGVLEWSTGLECWTGVMEAMMSNGADPVEPFSCLVRGVQDRRYGAPKAIFSTSGSKTGVREIAFHLNCFFLPEFPGVHNISVLC
jgi:hypothetical protein